MCGVFGGRRGRTGVGIVGRGACGALTKTCVWRFAGKAGECEATERGGGEAMASDADDGDGDAARRTAGVSDRQARAGVASAGKRQHQVPLIGIGQCHAMTASNQVNFYTPTASNQVNFYTAKAANVQLAVPPTLAAGDWSVDSEGDGEGSSGDLHDGVSESDNNN